MEERFGRTLSTADRSRDDEVAKEYFLTNERKKIETKLTKGELTEEQAEIIFKAIDEYVQRKAGQTRQGFQRGLTALIENLLVDIMQTENEQEQNTMQSHISASNR